MLVRLTCSLALTAHLALAADTVPARASRAITQQKLLQHIRTLASDEFEGRAPATPGEQKTVDYLIAACRAMKLKPGNPDGTYVQKVALYGISTGGGIVAIKSKGADFALAAGDYDASSTQPKPAVEIPESQVVFAGYGVVAPEYNWDDYQGLDVKGKAVVVLAGDPPVADPNDPSKLDPKMFLGPELSFHGRPGTKADVAFRHGATAIITLRGVPPGPFPVRPPGAGGGPLRFLQREVMIVRDSSSLDRIAVTVMLEYGKARQLFASAGLDLDALRESAVSGHFHALPLPQTTISATVKHDVRQIESSNVVAKLDGNDPVLRNQYVVYSGHWDHLGRQGGNIYHGASDNASGTAGVLELARAFAALPKAPKRTVVFLWPTAEEKGLLGAKYYVQHPLYPLRQTVANINLDYFSNWGWGRTKDFSVLGLGMSTLDDLTKQAVERQGRVLTGDTDPVEGFYWRSDHVEFSMGGVPSMAMSPGIEHLGKPAGFGAAQRDKFIRDDYHKPSDQVKTDWDLSGAVEDLRVLLEVGYRVAQSPERPRWTNRPAFMHNPYAGE